MDKRDYSPPPLPPLPPPPPPPPTLAAAARIESFTFPEMLPTPRKKKNKNKRRFSDEQVKLLETMFESETKLEPKRKVQLARELGLQPRQVAIWFQNRRARWKSKQIEKEYRILGANYDNLKSRYESLKKEKQSMLMQLKKLSDLLEKPHDRSKDMNGLAGNSTDGVSDNGDTNCEKEVNPDCSREGLDHKVIKALDDDECKNIGCTGFEEETKLLNMGEHDVEGSSTSPEKWCRVDASELFDHSCSDSQWWDFWT